MIVHCGAEPVGAVQLGNSPQFPHGIPGRGTRRADRNPVRMRRRGPCCFPADMVLSPLATGHSSLATRNYFPAAPLRPPAAGRKSASFASTIPPWLDLSCNLPMTNTRAIWLRSGAFLSPPAPSLRIHWPLFSRPTPHSTGHLPPGQRGQVMRRPPPLATAWPWVAMGVPSLPLPS